MKLVNPQNITNGMIDLPKTDKTVKAVSLLTPEEQIEIPKFAAFIGVCYGDKAYLVYPHAQVPEGATALRGQEGLVGISAVCGG